MEIFPEGEVGYTCLVNFKGASPSLGTEKAGKDVTINIHENEKS